MPASATDLAAALLVLESATRTASTLGGVLLRITVGVSDVSHVNNQPNLVADCSARQRSHFNVFSVVFLGTVERVQKPSSLPCTAGIVYVW